MSLSGISVGSLILIALIVLLLFGTKKIRHIGGDLGGAIRDFKHGLHQGGETPSAKTSEAATPKEDEARKD